MAFGIFKKRQPTGMDAVIRLMYGDNPPKKSADFATACKLAYSDLLLETVSFESVRNCAQGLFDSPMPYSTYDLATSVALSFLKDNSLVPKLYNIQLSARLQVSSWAKDGKVAAPLAHSFESVLYNLYKITNQSPPTQSTAPREDDEISRKLDAFRAQNQGTSPQVAAREVKKFLVWQRSNALEAILDLQESSDTDITEAKVQLIERSFAFGAAVGAMYAYSISTERRDIFFQNVVGQYLGLSELEEVHLELTNMAEASNALPDACETGTALIVAYLLNGPQEEDKTALASVIETLGA